MRASIKAGAGQFTRRSTSLDYAPTGGTAGAGRRARWARLRAGEVDQFGTGAERPGAVAAAQVLRRGVVGRRDRGPTASGEGAARPQLGDQLSQELRGQSGHSAIRDSGGSGQRPQHTMTLPRPSPAGRPANHPRGRWSLPTGYDAPFQLVSVTSWPLQQSQCLDRIYAGGPASLPFKSRHGIVSSAGCTRRWAWPSTCTAASNTARVRSLARSARPARRSRARPVVRPRCGSTRPLGSRSGRRHAGR